MNNYKVYRWMLAEGLGLKGLPLSLFALVFSFTRSGRTMFESEESLAACFGYSREHVCVIMRELSRKGLLTKGTKHDGLQTNDYSVNIAAVARMLGPPTCSDPDMLKAFKDSLSKTALQECEKILQADVRKSDISCEKISQQDVRKPYTPCEKISHNNKSYNSINNQSNKYSHGKNRNSSIEVPSSYEGD
jgi:hypothetical protein